MHALSSKTLVCGLPAYISRPRREADEQFPPLATTGCNSCEPALRENPIIAQPSRLSQAKYCERCKTADVGGLVGLGWRDRLGLHAQKMRAVVHQLVNGLMHVRQGSMGLLLLKALVHLWTPAAR